MSCKYDADAKMWEGAVHRDNTIMEFGGDTEQESEEDLISDGG